uniref:Zinc finger piccolo-type domain-containing protein n=1 Tax=Electrophorus electricus TaxID=8005 RepID=A0A4W4FB17_ELEEL
MRSYLPYFLIYFNFFPQLIEWLCLNCQTQRAVGHSPVLPKKASVQPHHSGKSDFSTPQKASPKATPPQKDKKAKDIQKLQDQQAKASNGTPPVHKPQHCTEITTPPHSSRKGSAVPQKSEVSENSEKRQTEKIKPQEKTLQEKKPDDEKLRAPSLSILMDITESDTTKGTEPIQPLSKVCPLCKMELRKDPPNYNICIECKNTVCDLCGFNPMPDHTEVKEWLCLNCQIQRVPGPPPVQPQANKAPPPASPQKKETSAPDALQKESNPQTVATYKDQKLSLPAKVEDPLSAKSQEPTSISTSQPSPAKSPPPQKAEPPKKESSFFGFGGPRSQSPSSQPSVSAVPGKVLGFGSSIFSSASNLITSVVQNEPSTTPPTSRKGSTVSQTAVKPESTPPASRKESVLQIPPKPASSAKTNTSAENTPTPPTARKGSVLQKQEEKRGLEVKLEDQLSNAPITSVKKEAPLSAPISICPICKGDLKKDQPNYNTCTECKNTVCNLCGFTPVPQHTCAQLCSTLILFLILFQVKKWLCLNCKIQQKIEMEPSGTPIPKPLPTSLEKESQSLPSVPMLAEPKASDPSTCVDEKNIHIPAILKKDVPAINPQQETSAGIKQSDMNPQNKEPQQETNPESAKSQPELTKRTDLLAKSGPPPQSKGPKQDSGFTGLVFGGGKSQPSPPKISDSTSRKLFGLGELAETARSRSPSPKTVDEKKDRPGRISPESYSSAEEELKAIQIAGESFIKLVEPNLAVSIKDDLSTKENSSESEQLPFLQRIRISLSPSFEEKNIKELIGENNQQKQYVTRDAAIASPVKVPKITHQTLSVEVEDSSDNIPLCQNKETEIMQVIHTLDTSEKNTVNISVLNDNEKTEVTDLMSIAVISSQPQFPASQIIENNSLTESTKHRSKGDESSSIQAPHITPLASPPSDTASPTSLSSLEKESDSSPSQRLDHQLNNLLPVDDICQSEDLWQTSRMKVYESSSFSDISPSIEPESENFLTYQLPPICSSIDAVNDAVEKTLKSAEEIYEEMMQKAEPLKAMTKKVTPPEIEPLYGGMLIEDYAYESLVEEPAMATAAGCSISENVYLSEVIVQEEARKLTTPEEAYVEMQKKRELMLKGKLSEHVQVEKEIARSDFAVPAVTDTCYVTVRENDKYPVYKDEESGLHAEDVLTPKTSPTRSSPLSPISPFSSSEPLYDSPEVVLTLSSGEEDNTKDEYASEHVQYAMEPYIDGSTSPEASLVKKALYPIPDLKITQCSSGEEEAEDEDKTQEYKIAMSNDQSDDNSKEAAKIIMPSSQSNSIEDEPTFRYEIPLSKHVREDVSPIVPPLSPQTLSPDSTTSASSTLLTDQIPESGSISRTPTAARSSTALGADSASFIIVMPAPQVAVVTGPPGKSSFQEISLSQAATSTQQITSTVKCPIPPEVSFSKPPLAPKPPHILDYSSLVSTYTSSTVSINEQNRISFPSHAGIPASLSAAGSVLPAYITASTSISSAQASVPCFTPVPFVQMSDAMSTASECLIHVPSLESLKTPDSTTGDMPSPAFFKVPPPAPVIVQMSDLVASSSQSPVHIANEMLIPAYSSVPATTVSPATDRKSIAPTTVSIPIHYFSPDAEKLSAATATVQALPVTSPAVTDTDGILKSESQILSPDGQTKQGRFVIILPKNTSVINQTTQDIVTNSGMVATSVDETRIQPFVVSVSPVVSTDVAPMEPQVTSVFHERANIPVIEFPPPPVALPSAILADNLPYPAVNQESVPTPSCVRASSPEFFTSMTIAAQSEAVNLSLTAINKSPPPVPPKPVCIPSGLVFSHRSRESIKPPNIAEHALSQTGHAATLPRTKKPPNALSLSLNAPVDSKHNISSPKSPLSPRFSKTLETYVVITLPSEPGSPIESITTQAPVRRSSLPTSAIAPRLFIPPALSEPLVSTQVVAASPKVVLAPAMLTQTAVVPVQTVGTPPVPETAVQTSSTFISVPVIAMPSEVAPASSASALTFVPQTGTFGPPIIDKMTNYAAPSMVTAYGAKRVFSSPLATAGSTILSAPVSATLQIPAPATMVSDSVELDRQHIQTVCPAPITDHRTIQAIKLGPSTAPVQQHPAFFELQQEAPVVYAKTVMPASALTFAQFTNPPESQELRRPDKVVANMSQMYSAISAEQHPESLPNVVTQMFKTEVQRTTTLSVVQERIPLEPVSDPGSVEIILGPEITKTQIMSKQNGKPHYSGDIIDLTTLKVNVTMTDMGMDLTAPKTSRESLSIDSSGRQATAIKPEIVNLTAEIPPPTTLSVVTDSISIVTCSATIAFNNNIVDKPLNLRSATSKTLPLTTYKRFEPLAQIVYRPVNSQPKPTTSTEIPVNLSCGTTEATAPPSLPSTLLVTVAPVTCINARAGVPIHIEPSLAGAIDLTTSRPKKDMVALSSSSGVVTAVVEDMAPVDLTAGKRTVCCDVLYRLPFTGSCRTQPPATTQPGNQLGSRDDHSKYDNATTLGTEKLSKMKASVSNKPDPSKDTLPSVLANLLPSLTAFPELYSDATLEAIAASLDTLVSPNYPTTDDTKSQLYQAEREFLQLEKLKQLCLAEELEWERHEIQRYREQEQIIVQKELEELQSMKQKLLMQQEEERKAHLMLQQETFAQQQLQLEQIHQLQKKLQQQLQEQKMYSYGIETNEGVLQPTTSGILDPQYTIGDNGQYWPVKDDNSILSVVTSHDPVIGQDRHTASSSLPESEAILKDTVDQKQNFKKLPSTAKHISEQNVDLSCKKIAEGNVKTDEEDGVERPYSGRKRRSRRSVDSCVQTDDEDQDEWDVPVRSRRRSRSRYADGERGKGSKVSSIAIQTVAEISVQTDHSGTINRSPVRAQVDTTVDLHKGGQPESDSDVTSEKDKKQSTPVEIGVSTQLKADGIGVTLVHKSPNVLYSPVSPVSPGKGTLKILSAEPSRHPTSPRSLKGSQRSLGSLSDPKSLSPTTDDRIMYQYSDAYSVSNVNKVKRTLPHPPPEDDTIAGPSGYSTGSARRRMCRTTTLARAKILQDIDKELDLVERESSKLRKKQAELDEEEKEIDAKLRYLEMGINRRKEALLKEREKRERAYLQGVAEERDYMSDSEVSNIRGAQGNGHGLERPRTAPQSEFNQFIPPQTEADSQYAHLESPYSHYQYASQTGTTNHYSQQTLYQQQSLYHQQTSPYQTQSVYSSVPTLNQQSQQTGYDHASQLLLMQQKNCQTTLSELETKINTNYEVIRNQPLLIVPTSTDYGVSHLGGKYSNLELRMGLEERGSMASSPMSSISAESFYADIDHHNARNYVMIDDIGELTKSSPGLGSSFNIPDKDMSKTDRLLRAAEVRRTADVADFLGPLQAASRLHSYGKPEEDSMEEPYELKLLKQQIKQEFRRGTDGLEQLTGLPHYLHSDSFRHFPKSEKYSIGRLTLEKQAAKQLPASVLYQKQLKNKRALIDPKITKFSPIQETRDLEPDYSSFLASTGSAMGGLSSRARLLQDEITFGLRKNIAEQQKYLGSSLSTNLAQSLNLGQSLNLSQSLRTSLQEDGTYPSVTRSRSSSRPSSAYGLDLSIKRDLSSSSLRLKAEGEGMDSQFGAARAKPTSLPISQSRGRIPIVAQNSEEESPLSPVGQPMGMARASAGPLPPISADSRDQFGSSHSLPEVQQHMREESRTRGYDRDIAFIMDDLQGAMSDSEGKFAIRFASKTALVDMCHMHGLDSVNIFM